MARYLYRFIEGGLLFVIWIELAASRKFVSTNHDSKSVGMMISKREVKLQVRHRTLIKS